jgi:hypothetical protein
MRSVFIFLMGLGIVLYAPAAFSAPTCPALKNPCDYVKCQPKVDTRSIS